MGFAWVLRGTKSFFCLNVNAKDINVSLPVLYFLISQHMSADLKGPKVKYI